MKIILINGPPRSGKDTAGEIIHGILNTRKGPDHITPHLDKFAELVKERAHGLYGLVDQDGPLFASYFEDVKDQPRSEFLGLTPRQAYIAVSETYYKPTHGENIFGRLMLERIRSFHKGRCGVVILTDSGFAPEAQVLIDEYGAGNVFLIRLHRPGFDFEGDSRGYIHLDGIDSVDVTATTVEELRSELKTLFKRIPVR